MHFKEELWIKCGSRSKRSKLHQQHTHATKEAIFQLEPGPKKPASVLNQLTHDQMRTYRNNIPAYPVMEQDFNNETRIYVVVFFSPEMIDE